MKKRRGFTLIEVLIVVVIIAILAATILPQVGSSSADAKSSAMKFDLNVLRKQIAMYKLQHNGTPPGIVSGDLPGLTMASDANGTTSATSSTTYRFGPYVQGGKMPVNPYDNKNTVSQIAAFPPSATTAAGGWLYEPVSGQIAANTAGHLAD